MNPVKNTTDFLQEVITHKHAEVARIYIENARHGFGISIRTLPDPLSFSAAINASREAERRHIIAEIKPASPAAGIINDKVVPYVQAEIFATGGASCLSVLTDEHYFHGHLNNLVDARRACGLPLLRKDFIIDEIQVDQARAYGADAVLLIMRAVRDEAAKSIMNRAKDLGMEVVVEINDQDDLYRAKKLRPKMLLINNRNLNTLKVNMDTVAQLAPLIDTDKHIVIGASGYGDRQSLDLATARGGVNVFLIGEMLMRQKDPMGTIVGLLKNAPKSRRTNPTIFFSEGAPNENPSRQQGHSTELQVGNAESAQKNLGFISPRMADKVREESVPTTMPTSSHSPHAAKPQHAIAASHHMNFSHLNAAGNVHMVDVSAKPETQRIAIATAEVVISEEAMRLLRSERLKKGDVLATARTAGIMAAKRTSERIPLCHPIPLTHSQIDFHIRDAQTIGVRAECHTVGKTGVEIEAMDAAGTAALTIYDMVKSVDRSATIQAIRLEEKSGGKSGHWQR